MINDNEEKEIMNPDEKNDLTNYKKKNNEYSNKDIYFKKKFCIFKFMIFLLFIIYFIITFDFKELIITYNKEETQLYYLGKYFFIKKEVIDSFNKYIDTCRKGILIDKNVYNLTSNPKITVIMPIYNGGKYLFYSLRSIQNQKMKDIEIILTNDCSTDDSLSIIENYMKEDPRIRLIRNIKNRKILYSKSISALNAKGKYILQLDQDDMFISDEAFDTLYNKAEENNLDLLQFKDITSKELHVKMRKTSYHIKQSYKEIKTQPEIKNKYFNGYNYMLWGMLFKADIYKKTVNHYWKNIINYKIVHFEDYQITFFIVNFAKRFQAINYFFMIHLMHSESTTSTRTTLKEVVFSILFAANNMFDYHIKDNPEDINMFMNFYPPFGIKFKDFKGIEPNFTVFLLKKFFDNPKLSYKEKLESIYYKQKEFGGLKIWNIYEYIMDSKEYNSILSYQNLIGKNIKKFIKNINSNPKYSIIIYCNVYKNLLMTLNSIENQIYNNYEVILIYDNNNLTELYSIQNIIEEYNNIRLVNNINEKGLFNSYIDGILESNGQYILTIKSGHTFATENFFNELNKYINDSIDIIEFNLLINNYEDVRNNSLSLYRCLHFKSNINSNLYKFNRYYKEIDQEKELIVNKIIKSEIYKNIINEYKNALETKIVYNYFDEIIIFLINLQNIQIKHIDIFGIIEYTNVVKSFNLNIINNNKDQLVQDTIFYINFLFDYSNNTIEDKKYVIYEFYNVLNIIYNKSNEISEDANELINKFLNCKYISQYKKDNLKFYYDSLLT